MILVIANRGQYNHRIYRTIRDLGESVKLVSNIITSEKIKNMGADAIVIGGGPYIEESGNCGNIIIELKEELPILGICLGHQIMAKTFGAEIGRASFAEYAEEEIIVDDEDEILLGLSPTFTAWVSHKDEVKALPENFLKLAHSNKCEIEAMKHESLPLFGLQFHPEVEHTPRGKEIFKNFLRVVRK